MHLTYPTKGPLLACEPASHLFPSLMSQFSPPPHTIHTPLTPPSPTSHSPSSHSITYLSCLSAQPLIFCTGSHQVTPGHTSPFWSHLCHILLWVRPPPRPTLFTPPPFHPPTPWSTSPPWSPPPPPCSPPRSSPAWTMPSSVRPAWAMCTPAASSSSGGQTCMQMRMRHCRLEGGGGRGVMRCYRCCVGVGGEDEALQVGGRGGRGRRMLCRGGTAGVGLCGGGRGGGGGGCFAGGALQLWVCVCGGGRRRRHCSCGCAWRGRRTRHCRYGVEGGDEDMCVQV